MESSKDPVLILVSGFFRHCPVRFEIYFLNARGRAGGKLISDFPCIFICFPKQFFPQKLKAVISPSRPPVAGFPFNDGAQFLDRYRLGMARIEIVP